MPELISNLLDVVLPIAICVLVGFTLARLELPFDNNVIGSLVRYVGYPTLILSHLSAEHIELNAFLTMLGAALAMVASFFILATLVLRLLRLPFRAYIAPMSLNNAGNVGIPVATTRLRRCWDLLRFGVRGGDPAGDIHLRRLDTKR